MELDFIVDEISVKKTKKKGKSKEQTRHVLVPKAPGLKTPEMALHVVWTPAAEDLFGKLDIDDVVTFNLSGTTKQSKLKK